METFREQNSTKTSKNVDGLRLHYVVLAGTLIGLLAISGCSETPLPFGCNKDSDCPGGAFCVREKCVEDDNKKTPNTRQTTWKKEELPADADQYKYTALSLSPAGDVWVAGTVVDDQDRSTSNNILLCANSGQPLARFPYPCNNADTITGMWTTDKDVVALCEDHQELARYYEGAWTRFPLKLEGNFYPQAVWKTEYYGESVFLVVGGAGTDDNWKGFVSGSGMSSLAGDAPDELVSVWGSAVDNAWAVGYSNDEAANIVRCTMDKCYAVVNPSIPIVDFTGVWGSGPNDVWIVGEKGTILHWDGESFSTQWTLSSSPDLHLRAVSGISANDVWAVGGHGTVLHWNGEQWNQINTPAGESRLNAVRATEHDVWIVGDNIVLHRHKY